MGNYKNETITLRAKKFVINRNNYFGSIQIGLVFKNPIKFC